MRQAAARGRRPTFRGLALACVLLLGSCSTDAAGPETTPVTDQGANQRYTVVLNAEVYTLAADAEWAEAFAYDPAGTIIAVGPEAEVVEVAGDDARIIDADGGMVLPGFQDVHVHVPEAGLFENVCFFEPGLTLDDYEDIAADCAAEQADDAWVLGAGASLFALRDGVSPLAALDRAVPNRPALVIDDLGHAVWTNSLGLEAAGIGLDDPDPQGGVFHRDANGELTGLLLEDAQQLVRNAAAADDATIDAGLRDSLPALAANGVTSISDAGGYWAQGHVDAWERIAAERELTVRAVNALYVYPNLDMDEQLDEFESRFRRSSGDLLQIDTAKIYIDGILELGTALLVEPYDVPPDANYPSGFRYFEPDQLTMYVAELHAMGFRINFHAIGDAAIREALDAIEAIDDDPTAVAERRHRITHTYIVHPNDIDRFADLGVVADFQQSPDAIDPLYHEDLTEIIGDRAFDLIPTGTLVEAGASVTLSSDWDAGPLPPLGTIERSLTRESNAVPDLATALALATIEAAAALGHDDITGSIEVGKQADYVVLDSNLFEVDVQDIDRTAVLLTVVDGAVVFDSKGMTN